MPAKEPLRIFILALALTLLAHLAFAQTGAPSDCSGSVGLSAAAISFPAAGKTGPTVPTRYVTIFNSHATQNLWVNPTPGGTAAANTAGSAEIVPAGSLSWYQPAYPPPQTISIVGSGAATTYTCWYQ